MSTDSGMRLRNESKDEADSTRHRFNESLQRLGSVIHSSGSMILRLEEDLLDQRNSVSIIEAQLLKVEKELIGATGEMHLDKKTSGESPFVLQSESLAPNKSGNNDDDDADRSPRASADKSSDSAKQKSIAGTDSKKKKSISHRSPDPLDFDLLRLVFQCVMSLSQESRARQVEASCRLIQRVFRGYVVRKSFKVSRLKRSDESLVTSEDLDLDLDVFVKDEDRSSTESKELSCMTSSSVTPKNDDDISSGVETKIQEESRKSKPTLKSSLAKLISVKHSHHQRQDAQPQQPQQHRPSLPSLQPSSSLSPGSRRSWSVSRISSSEWNDSDDGFVRGRRELHQLQTLLSSKISSLRKKQPSVPDIIFCQTLEDIHSQLTSKGPMEAAEKGTSDAIYSYNDLMSHFEETLKEKMNYEMVAEQFVNTFHAILSEFLKKKKSLGKKDSSKEKPKKKTTQKTQTISESAAVAAVEGGLSQVTFQSAARCSSSAPEFVTQLMEEVESRGLSVVGIYRVTGNSVKIKQLIRDIDSKSPADVDFSAVDIHVMTSVLKSFLRNLPQPLIAFHVYDELSHLPQNDVTTEARTRILNDLYNKLLPHNQKLLDGLLSHLARVVLNESMNKMSANALAITFSPCLVRLPNENSLSIEELKTPVQRRNEFVQLLIEAKLQELKKEEEVERPEMNPPDADDVSVDVFTASETSDDVIGEETDSYSNDVISTDESHDVVDDAFAADDDRDADHVTDSSSTDEETGEGAPNDP